MTFVFPKLPSGITSPPSEFLLLKLKDCIKGKKGTQTVRNNRSELVQAPPCQARWEIPLGTNLLGGFNGFCNPKTVLFSLQLFFPPETQHNLNSLSCYLACFPNSRCHTGMKKKIPFHLAESKIL